MNTVKLELIIRGMHCPACETRLVKALSKLNGMVAVSASFPENLVRVEYNPDICKPETIAAAISHAGYELQIDQPAPAKKSNSLLPLVLIFGMVVVLSQYSGSLDMTASLQGQVTYLLLFTIGIFTSLHCVGMCGGIMLSQSLNQAGTKTAALVPALSYNAGRLISYTLLGGLVGALGSILSLSLEFMALFTIAAGFFMALMGLNMAGFNLGRKWLRLPLPSGNFSRPKTPFVVGLLNGLMPCGPLQTMQLYALSTGSASAGATAMFVFALGTIPLMLTFGSLSALLSKQATSRLLKFSGVFIIVLGLVMTNRGLSLAGWNLPFSQVATQSTTGSALKAEMSDGTQTLTITADQNGYTPNILFVQKGIPLKLVVDGRQINSCNNEIIVPKLNLRKKLQTGQNVLEFTPQEDNLTFSCWMGMLNGIIKVVDDLAAVDVTKVAVAAPVNKRCCSSDGSSGCGGQNAGAASIYGDDLRKVPTDRLIKKAELGGGAQTAYLKGTGYELEPLIIVLQQHTPATLVLDLANFDDPSGEWVLYDYQKKAVLKTFTVEKTGVQLPLSIGQTTSLGLYKDQKIQAVIDVADQLATTDLETVRSKYLR